MKVATKFVSPLGPDQVQFLEALAEGDPSRRVRMRAHSLLLSSRGTSIDEIARIYQVHRDTVSSWLDRFAHHGVDGLGDKPRSGGPSTLDGPEKEEAKALLKKHPNAPKMVLALLHEKTGKSISSSTLRRLAKGAGLRWKRVRKSLKSKRDDAAFAEAKKEIEELKKNSNPEPLTWFTLTKPAFRWIPVFPMPGSRKEKPSRYRRARGNGSMCWAFSTPTMISLLSV